MSEDCPALGEEWRFTITSGLVDVLDISLLGHGPLHAAFVLSTLDKPQLVYWDERSIGLMPSGTGSPGPDRANPLVTRVVWPKMFTCWYPIVREELFTTYLILLKHGDHDFRHECPLDRATSRAAEDGLNNGSL
jgi:hypothetical protein